jgi:TolB-like protein
VTAPAPEVHSQLDRILASQTLAGSDQLKRLLRLVVERTLNGQSDLLKEYTLGLEAFHRPPDYDPKTDPIVRVQARRLRSKLGEYYASEGAGDALIIHIPKGAYVPVFEPRAAHAPPAESREGSRSRVLLVLAAITLVLAGFMLAWRDRRGIAASDDLDRSVAVLPLNNFTGDVAKAHISDQVTEVLTTELAKNGRLRVLSRTTASKYREPESSLPEIAQGLGVRWVIEGGVGVEGDHAYIKLRAVDASTDRKVWADVFDCDSREIVAVSTRAAATIGSAIEAQLRRRRD